MGFIAALMLSYMPEEESFWVLRALLSSGCDDTAEGCGPGRKGPKHAMRLMYDRQMRKTTKLLFVYGKLLEKFTPRAFAHLERMGVNVALFATQWFVTVFTYNFPFELVVRVWDQVRSGFVQFLILISLF